MTTQKFIDILFAAEILPGDLDTRSVQPASEDAPGLAQLGTATLGQPTPATPNSIPIHSRSGAKFGFVATDGLEPPYHHTYWLQEANDED
jgi:hypothetical protein